MATTNRTFDPKERVTPDRPCPVCGKPDWCLLEAIPWPTWAICARIASAEPRGGAGFLHRLGEAAGGATAALGRVVFSTKRARPPAPDDHLDRALAALLRDLHLGQRHHDDLIARGLAAEEVAAAGFASLALRGRSATCKRLGGALGDDFWTRVPGFFVKVAGLGEHLTLAGSPGLLVPVRNAGGQVVGVQIRRDGDADPRYLWLSSNPETTRRGRRIYPGGTGAEVRVHHSLLGDPTGELWVTEGALKADVTASLANVHCLGVPGVNAWRKLRDAALTATDEGEPVVIAFDADRDTNPHVRRALADLGAELQAAGRRVLVASWPTVPDAAGDPHPKGIDDALLAGAPVALHPLDADLFTERVRQVAGVALPADEPGDGDDLATAERKIRGAATGRLLDLGRPDAAGVTVFADPPGVGKTSGVARALRDHAASGRWPTRRDRAGVERPRRVAFLTDDLRTGAMVADLLGPAGVLVAGRSFANCHRSSETLALGTSRHNVMATACSSCKRRWEADHSEPWRCEYLAQKERAERAYVTVACKGALLNQSDALTNFELVVIDEGLDEHVIDRFALDRPRLDAWAAGMDRLHRADADRYTSADPQRRLLRLLLLTLAGPPPDAERPELDRLRDALAAVADADGEDLGELVADCRARRPHRKTGLFAFERPRDDATGELVEHLDARGERFVVLRAFGELVDALSAELHRPAGADARLWLDRHRDEPDLVLAYLPREKCLRRLRERQVFVLDATPDLAALALALGVEPEVVRSDVRERVHVTQITNSLYTAAQLRADKGARRTLAAVRERWEEEHPGGAALARKAFAAELGADGHFGRDDRRHSEWEDRDNLAMLGHYSRPLDEVQAEVQARRFAERPPARDEGRQAWRPYLHVDGDGRSLARRRPTHPDPDVQDRIDFERWAQVRQAVGRLRPARKAETVHLLIADADPVPGLRIDRLVSASEYLGRDLSARRLRSLANENARRRTEQQRQVLDVTAHLDPEVLWAMSTCTLQELLADAGYPRGNRERLAVQLAALRLGIPTMPRVVTTDLTELFTFESVVTTLRIGGFAAPSNLAGFVIPAPTGPVTAPAPARAPPGAS